MTYAAVYRSTAPAVLERLARFDRERRAWSDAVEALWREAGFPEGTVAWITRGGVAWGDRLSGLQLPEGATAPKGWVAAKDRDGHYLPNRGSKVGRAAGDLVKQLGTAPSIGSVLTDCGMPRLIMSGLSMRQPALNSEGEPPTALWVGWSIDPEAVALHARANGGEPRRENGDIDMAHWDRVPLSEFYALIEAGQKPLPMGDRS